MERLNKKDQYYYGLVVFYRMITREIPLVTREDYTDFTNQVINYYLFYWQAMALHGEDKREGTLRVVGDLDKFEELEKKSGLKAGLGSRYLYLARLIPINIITKLSGYGCTLSGDQAYSFVSKKVNAPGREFPTTPWYFNPDWYGYKAMRLYFNVTEFGIPEYPYDGGYRKIKRPVRRSISTGKSKKNKPRRAVRRASPRRSVRRASPRKSARRSSPRRSARRSIKSKRKKCRSNQVRNPATGRCILKSVFNRRRKSPKKSVSKKSRRMKKKYS